MTRLENWSIAPAEESFYQAPEMRQYVLQGVVYGHPKRSDGKKIRTSLIQAVIGPNTVRTLYTTYVLGVPDPEYLSWLKSNGYTYDAANPLRFK